MNARRLVCIYRPASLPRPVVYPSGWWQLSSKWWHLEWTLARAV